MLEITPERDLAMEVPGGFEAVKLLVQVQGDIVLDQDGAGGDAIGGVLRHLGEFELGDFGAPLADGLLESGVEGDGVELLDDIGASARGQLVTAGAADEDDLG